MKKTRLSIFLSVIVLATVMLIVLSCKKGATTPNIISEDATIVNEGDPAADGCGWLIKTSTTDSTYNAPALAAPYLVNNLKVHIAYHKLTPRYYCGSVPIPQNAGITEIQLDSIRTK